MFAISLPQLATQLVSFVLIILLLYVLLYRPVTRLMAARSERIKAGLEASDKAQAEVRKLAERTQTTISAARKEAQSIVEDARVAAARLREQRLAQAKLDAEATVAKADVEIARRQASAQAELKTKFGLLVLTAAEKVVQQSIDKRAHTELIEASLKEAVKANSGQ